ncbi:MAG: hypothetical protein VX599_00335 [Pseudomonadota bacterium]|nr:hypothetical protein [Pseudomonadota bacterium]
MTSILVAVRNFTIALILAWMGFSVSPDSDKDQESISIAPNATAFNLING